MRRQRHKAALLAISALVLACFVLLPWNRNGALGESGPAPESHPISDSGLSKEQASVAAQPASRIEVPAGRSSYAPAAGRVRLEFVGDPLPPRWTLRTNGAESTHGCVTEVVFHPTTFPTDVVGTWLTHTLFKTRVERHPSETTVTIGAHYALSFVADEGSDYASWTCYSTAAPIRDGDREFAVQALKFEAPGVCRCHVPLSARKQFAVWAPGRPVFFHDTGQSPAPLAWSSIQVRVHHEQGAPIRGRLVDLNGVPVPNRHVTLTRVYAEAGGGGNYMILDADRARARGGFAGTLQTDSSGSFTFAEASLEAQQPFHADVPGADVVSKSSLYWTTVEGTWIELVIR